jgi:ACR3 family arsenite transporter
VLLIGVSDIPLPWLTITYAVLLFIVAPTFIATVVRVLFVRRWGEDALKVMVKRFQPITMICLLLTLVLIFIFQGDDELH